MRILQTFGGKLVNIQNIQNICLLLSLVYVFLCLGAASYNELGIFNLAHECKTRKTPRRTRFSCYRW